MSNTHLSAVLAMAVAVVVAGCDGSGKDCHTGLECLEGTVCNQDGECVRACNTAADCESIEDCERGICFAVPEDERECVSNNDCIATVELTQCQVAEDPFCQAGKCAVHNLNPGDSCSDDDVCTLDDACDERGVCTGVNVVCNTPPRPECVGGNGTLRTYTVPGQCNAVTADCFYVPIDISCPNCGDTCLARCTADLALYYPFLEGVGVDRYQDNSSNNNYGSCVLGSTCPTNGVSGPQVVSANNLAVEFDGVDDRLVAVDDATLEPVDFTLTAWVYLPSDVTLPMNGQVVGKRGAGDFNNYSYSISIAGNPPAVSCEIVNGGVANATGSQELELDRWHHLGCVFSSADTSLELFVDGVTPSGTAIVTTILPPDTDGPFVVGADGDQATAPFEGLIDEVRLCGAVLEDVALCHLSGGTWDANLTWDDPGAVCRR